MSYQAGKFIALAQATVTLFVFLTGTTRARIVTSNLTFAGLGGQIGSHGGIVILMA